MQSIYHLPRYPVTTYKFLKYGNFAKINISYQGTPVPINTQYMVILPKSRRDSRICQKYQLFKNFSKKFFREVILSPTNSWKFHL